MRVLLVVSSGKFTGAAAVAEACCRSLLAVGVEARLLFVAGNNLERRLRREPWALPALVKERRPGHLRANLATLRAAGARAEVVLCHLPHDHLLCVLASLHRRLALVRAYRRGEHLRPSPAARWLARRAAGALLAHSALAPALDRLAPGLPALALPAPLEDRFAPGADRQRWRRRLEIPADAPVLGMVGKLARGRGFELLLETAARVLPAVHPLLVGHGEAAAALERRAERLGLDERLALAGYQERELPELYTAMDVVAFAAAGSDHGHRAISEAQGCGRPVVAAAVDGVGDLVEEGRTGLVGPAEPAALAAAVSRLLADRGLAARLGRDAAAAVASRRFVPSGERLRGFLGAVYRERVESRP